MNAKYTLGSVFDLLPHPDRQPLPSSVASRQKMSKPSSQTTQKKRDTDMEVESKNVVVSSRLRYLDESSLSPYTHLGFGSGGWNREAHLPPPRAPACCFIP